MRVRAKVIAIVNKERTAAVGLENWYFASIGLHRTSSSRHLDRSHLPPWLGQRFHRISRQLSASLCPWIPLLRTTRSFGIQDICCVIHRRCDSDRCPLCLRLLPWHPCQELYRHFSGLSVERGSHFQSCGEAIYVETFPPVDNIRRSKRLENVSAAFAVNDGNTCMVGPTYST